MVGKVVLNVLHCLKLTTYAICGTAVLTTCFGDVMTSECAAHFSGRAERQGCEHPCLRLVEILFRVLWGVKGPKLHVQPDEINMVRLKSSNSVMSAFQMQTFRRAELARWVSESTGARDSSPMSYFLKRSQGGLSFS